MNFAVRGALDILGTRSPVWILIVHDGLEMRDDYFSMKHRNFPEQATHNTTLSLEVARVGMLLCNGKASVLDEQARLAKYITTQEDEGPSL